MLLPPSGLATSEALAFAGLPLALAGLAAGWELGSAASSKVGTGMLIPTAIFSDMHRITVLR